ncbi:MAG: segregation and condensation protein A [Gammaproteobacteria bacterium]
MSDKTSDSPSSMEHRILRAVKSVLTDVVRDTATAPGLRHPLSDKTIDNIRECLKLISARERELVEAGGGKMNMRPRFVDEPSTTTVVPIDRIGRPGKPKKK